MQENTIKAFIEKLREKKGYGTGTRKVLGEKTKELEDLIEILEKRKI